MEEISRMLERVLNGECIQPGEIGYEDTLPAKIRYQIRRISEKNQGVEARITRERDETKALIGEIAHQMRNPLAGVESYTQLLEGEISGEPGRTYLCALEQSEQRLHFLTESFIKMARLEQQMIQIKKTTDVLADTIFSAVLLVQKAAEEKQMEVEVTGAEETKVWDDGNWLGEAVYNLLDNSVKYAPEHSKIRVVVRQDEMYTRIVVSDDGIGIPVAAFHTHHIDSKLDEHIDIIFIYILHPAGCQNGKACAVRHIINGGKLMLHTVTCPVLLTSHAYQAVMGHGP